jgi:hypothetical protein
LCTLFEKDRKGLVRIVFWCDGCGDDTFSFQILTGLANKDIKGLVLGKPLVKEMTVELLFRQSEEQVIADSERKRGITK